MTWWAKIMSLFKTKEEKMIEVVDKALSPAIPDNKLMPEFASMTRLLLRRARMAGLNVDIFSGFRSFEEQNKLYAKRPRVTRAKGGQSWHNYGLAVDVVFKTSKGRWSWAERHDWEKLGKIGKSVGLEWGGDWRRFRDRPHFQMTGGIRIKQALALHKKSGLLGVWYDVKVRTGKTTKKG